MSDNTAELRRRAETRWKERRVDNPPPGTDADAQRLLHELEVHQIELEMQNAELQRARVEVETALEKYTELYDFAPVGYCSIDRQGVIQEVNLTGATMTPAGFCGSDEPAGPRRVPESRVCSARKAGL
jgi:PAS domain-containing protein